MWVKTAGLDVAKVNHHAAPAAKSGCFCAIDTGLSDPKRSVVSRTIEAVLRQTVKTETGTYYSQILSVI